MLNKVKRLNKAPLNYKKEQYKPVFTALGECTNICHIYQTVNIKAVVTSIETPKKYHMVIMILRLKMLSDDRGNRFIENNILSTAYWQSSRWLMLQANMFENILFQNEQYFKCTSNTAMELIVVENAVNWGNFQPKLGKTKKPTLKKVLIFFPKNPTLSKFLRLS